MKTALFAPCYLDGKDPSGSDRIERVNRWLDYYRAIKDQLGFDQIYLSDDGSSFENYQRLKVGTDLRFLLNSKLERQGFPGGLDYPWCWRAFWQMKVAIECGFKKIIMCDTDTFILSPKLAHFIRALSSEWTAFHLGKYDFPSAELHILCEDAFPLYTVWTGGEFMKKNGLMMERDLPFTKINRDFNFDRWGEERLPQLPIMDAYSQAPLDVELRYDMPVSRASHR